MDELVKYILDRLNKLEVELADKDKYILQLKDYIVKAEEIRAIMRKCYRSRTYESVGDRSIQPTYRATQEDIEVLIRYFDLEGDTKEDER